MSLFRCLEFGGCILSVALVLPAAPKPEASRCTSQTPTAQSYTWNFKSEAQNLLDQVGADARQVREHADQLESFMAGDEADWRSESDQLAAIRTTVNDMGTKLCRLEVIRRVTSPWEQKAIRGAAATIREMANDTESAIKFLNGNEDDLMNPNYRVYGTDLYNKSTKLASALHEFENYGKVSGEALQLQKTLGLTKRS